MRRYLDSKQISRVQQDFGFLISRVNNSCGELDFRLRDGYFNIYYQGNSLAFVGIQQKNYLVKIHHKFLGNNFFADDKRFSGKGTKQGDYVLYNLKSKQLKAFFQVKYLSKLQSHIARVGSSEEITFEHILITDNLNREDLIILDRQVTDAELRGKRIDLLALRQVFTNRYQFLVVEVKMGKNPDLGGAVLDQVKNYMDHIKNHITDWSKAYQETYRQMKILGLFETPEYSEIEIAPGVLGLIAVGGYSGLASSRVDVLKTKQSDVEIKQLVNKL